MQIRDNLCTEKPVSQQCGNKTADSCADSCEIADTKNMRYRQMYTETARVVGGFQHDPVRQNGMLTRQK